MDKYDMIRAFTSPNFRDAYFELVDTSPDNGGKRTLFYDHKVEEYVVLEKAMGDKFPTEKAREYDFEKAFKVWIGTRQMTIEEGISRAKEINKDWKQEQSEKESGENEQPIQGEHIIYSTNEENGYSRSGVGVIGADGNVYDAHTGELIGSSTDGSITIGLLRETPAVAAGDEAASD
jgi:hypothetical protein